MAESKFKSIKGSLVLESSSGGTLSFGFGGVKVPDEVSKVPEYVAELVRKELLGGTSSEIDALRDQLAAVRKELDKKIVELTEARALAKESTRSYQRPTTAAKKTSEKLGE